MAKKQRMKYTDEELAAMKIQAMLQGLDSSTVTNEVLQDDDIEIEIEDDEDRPAKKSRKAAKKKEEFVYEEKVIDTRPEFSKLKKNFTFDVVFDEHVIHYKEQRWPIPLRVVEYNVKLITNPQVAKACASEVTNNNETAANRAANGIDRYYRIETYDNVKNNCRYLGYIRVYVTNNGKLRSTLYINEGLLKSIYVNLDKFSKDMKGIMKSIV